MAGQASSAVKSPFDVAAPAYPVAMECSACADRPPLCPRCRDRRFQWHAGQARVMGMVWGERLRRLMPGRPWPTYETSERLQHITRKKVRGLSGGDGTLLDLLARACAEAARDMYERSAAPPLSISFRVDKK
jgi:hypothetical protein